MAINSRTKGATGEREIINLIKPVIERAYAQAGVPMPTVQRNSLQSHLGGSDIAGLHTVSIEVKRCEVLQVEKWWAQCMRQATGENKIPVLAYRKNRQPWRVRMWGWIQTGQNTAWQTEVEISMDDFLLWFEKHLAQAIKP